ncbi:MAG: rRNA pseudouridine synthase [Alphaproteobacteria bacterium]|nr:rRNA pseudouridine synthase [Alphaproteobacteria bacterium]
MSDKDPSSGDLGDGDRIAKVLARAGVCSRRDAEKLIAEGRVTVDGQKLATPAFKVKAGAKITVDGKLIAEPEKARLWRYHKPKGLVTSHRDEKGRATVFEQMPASMPRVISIGRLDYNSEGLLLLTNDGELARKLELPANGWIRKYRARVFGRLTQADLDGLLRGVMIEGIEYRPVEANLDRQQGGNAWATIALKEGKNREVRKLMEHIGVTVNRLIRISFGPFHLGQLKEGELDEIPSKVMREQMGIKKGVGWA